MPATIDTKLYSPKEAARRLDIGVDELRRLANERKITYVLVGKRKKFAPSDLVAYIAKCRAAAEATADCKPTKYTRKPHAELKDIREIRAAKLRGL